MTKKKQLGRPRQHGPKVRHTIDIPIEWGEIIDEEIREERKRTGYTISRNDWYKKVLAAHLGKKVAS